MVFVIEGLSDFMYNEETGMYEGYIYQIYNTFNMKSYIGQTSITIRDRMMKHKQKSRKHPSHSIHLYSDARDYGWDVFDVYEVEKICCSSKEELRVILNDKEMYHIQQYSSLYPNGYNIAKGGDVLPNTYEECKVYKFDLDGKLVASYDSMSDAARINNVSEADISNCCKGIKVVTVGGFYWSKNPVLILNTKIKRQKTRIDMYSSNGEFIKTFNSITEAVIEVYGDKKFKYHVQNSLRSGNPAGGYIWKRHEER